jgi:hypothetical protein
MIFLKKIYNWIKYVSLGLLLLGNLAANAQPFGNEWIQSSQTYYKIPIVESGIYRVSRQQLQNAGVPISSFSPQNVQLFFKGEEIPCFIQGESSGIIEYIEFYAEKNDGWFDAGLFESPEEQINPYYSEVNDTAAVFFTWNSGFNNNRYVNSSDQSFSGTPMAYCYREALELYTAKYNQDDQSSYYTISQGWMDNLWITLSTSRTKTIKTPGIYSSGKAEVEFALATLSRHRHHLQITGAGLSVDTVFYSVTGIKKNTQVNASELQEENPIVFQTIDDGDVPTDISSLKYIKVKYPAGFDFAGRGKVGFTIPASASKTYIRLSNFSAGNATVLLDTKNKKRIVPKISENTVEANIPAASAERVLKVASADSILTPSSIRKISVPGYALQQKQYVIVSNPALWDGAQAYAEYRNALLVNVNDLYNVFGYGINKHPLAIRNFIRYIANSWTTPPKHIFMLGKGMVLKNIRESQVYYKACMVPTLGDPGSDVQFVSQLFSDSYASEISIGRLAAQTSYQVNHYLNKVKEFEANTPAAWMKQAMNFGGGQTTSEQIRFANYLKGYESIFEDTLMGGYVSTFLKESSDPLEVTKSDTITQLMNNGVSLITFFGHGSVYGFDQNIDEPSYFSNQGKYPFLIANSCYTGNCHVATGESNSEKWVLIPNKGAIAFLAMSFQGYNNYLNFYTSAYYHSIFQEHYGTSIGEAASITGQSVLNKYGSMELMRNTVQQFTLHGDPALVLNSFDKPDITLDENSIHFIPSEITTELDSFSLQIVPCNISKAFKQDFSITIERIYPDGTLTDTNVVIHGLLFKDTVTIKFPTDRTIGKGPNIFNLYADRMNIIDEYSEDNNTVSIQTIIRSNDMTALFPVKNAMVNGNQVVLKAASGDVFSNNLEVSMEIDTSYLFTHPQTMQFNYSGGLLEWKPDIAFQENQAYFWRVGSKKEADNIVWNNSAFVVDNIKNGWKQNSFGQQTYNSLNLLETQSSKHQFGFVESPKTLSCRNIGSASGAEQWGAVSFAINGEGDQGGCYQYNAIHVVVIDTLYIKPWESDHGEYGHKNYPQCSGLGEPSKYFSFDARYPSAIDALHVFIDEVIPEGYHFLLYTFSGGNFTTWTEENKAYFESIGADVRDLSNKQAYILYMQKGNIGSLQEVKGLTDTDVITFSVDLEGNFSFGNMKSEIVGPAKDWVALSWQGHGTEEDNNDNFFVNLYGFDQGLNKTLLKDSINTSSFELNSIDENKYPFLQLEFICEDKVNLTPAVLDFWEIEYVPVSDLALNPIEGLVGLEDTIQEGKEGHFSMSIENIGNTAYDSIPVAYWLQDAQNKLIPLQSRNKKPLSAGETVQDSISFPTLYLPGFNSIWMEVNPKDNSGEYSLQEQYHFNNIVQKSFFVARDNSNPFLEVTFDGRQIMDGDIVSPSPEILIQLKDDNPYIPLNDTSIFYVYLKKQGTDLEEKISISNNPQMQFVEGSLPENKSKLIYSPNFTDDGIYELRVQAKDPSGNSSGNQDYLISFQVINESTITRVFNYPNPFTTSTRFVFELTGAVIPDELRIDIFSVSGKLVKVIYQDELGTIGIGKNITDYAWDGTDTYGDRLGNGVYFYKVTAKINGETIKDRETEADKFFKNGFGKMYLFR